MGSINEALAIADKILDRPNADPDDDLATMARGVVLMHEYATRPDRRMVKAREDEPFGRQPLPVKITLEGNTKDVGYWMREFMRRVESLGHDATITSADTFTLYPRAVND